MNKIVIKLCALVLLLTFPACTSDNDDNITKNPSSIEGVWKLTKETIEVPIDLNNDGVVSDILFEAPGFFGNSELIINDAANGTLYFSAFKSYHTRDENGELIYMTASSTSGNRVDVPITYIFNEGSGNIIYNGIESNFIINGNLLSMTVENGFFARDIDTNEITVSQDLTYEFTRQ